MVNELDETVHADRCTFCRWRPDGAIDFYCMFHWAERHVSGQRCECGQPAVWFLRKKPVCVLHGGRFPVAAPGPCDKSPLKNRKRWVDR